MGGTTRSSDGLDTRRRRLLFRCWHRGIREMDLIMGRFADAEIASLTDGELAELALLVRDQRPRLDPGARARLDERADARFAARRVRAPRRRALVPRRAARKALR